VSRLLSRWCGPPGLAILLAGALVACGGTRHVSDLREYKRLRGSPAGDDVARRLPKLTGAADALYLQAEAADDAGRAEEAAHLARLARWQFLAAEAYAQRKVQQMRLAEVLNRQRLMDERLADARRRERAAIEGVERAARFEQMATRLSQLPPTPDGRRLVDVLTTLRLADERASARLAPADDVQAIHAFQGALAALEDARAATSAQALAVDRAVQHGQRLLADVTPRFAEEARRQAVEAQLRALLAQASTVPELEARLEGRGLVLTMRQLFADGSQAVMPHRLPYVDRVAALLMSTEALAIRIEGHTDARTDVDAALNASAGRATSVRDRLAERGLAPHRLTVVGKGGAEPIADNATKDGRSRNRRIEIVVGRVPAPPAPAVAPPPEAVPDQSMR
jgi:outer membrane protein OmpA-like peptidoglycan-associated protein